MNNTDNNHVVYNLSLGRCNWDLRTWILLSNQENREQIENIYEYGCQTKNINEFYKQFTHETTVAKIDLLMYKNPDDGLIWAGYRNQMDKIHEMISKGASDFEMCMRLAASNGHLEIVKLMVSKGVVNFYYSRVVARMNGHYQIVDFLQNLN